MKTNLINSLVSLSNIEVTLTYNQYLAYKNNELSLADIKFINNFDKELGKISENPYIYKFMIGCCAFILASFPSYVTYANVGSNDTSSLLFETIVITQEIIKWICITKGFVAIHREIKHGDDNGLNTLKTTLKYLIVYSILYLFPSLLDFTPISSR